MKFRYQGEAAIKHMNTRKKGDDNKVLADVHLWHALMDAIEAAEKAEPAAYRVECRWTAPTLDQTWRKYSDCVSRCAAGTVRDRVANSGDMESRIVPLYAGTPDEPRRSNTHTCTQPRSRP